MTLSLPTTPPREAAPAFDQEKTGLGNYFIANYPPFSFWTKEALPEALAVLQCPPKPDVRLGLYLHIPFCRKRCKFCYFRVYTDKNAREVETYLNALLKEVELYSQAPLIAGRPLDFVYFGGGTPSYLSAAQLHELFDGVKRRLRWEQPREVTFEAEPGTVQREKLVALKELGVTRLSLGVENFSDRILEENGRAHRSPEIFRVYEWAREIGFAQINVDLIAGMVGETWENWRDCIRKTADLQPDSITIYQMELPFNTVYSKEMLQAGQGTHEGIASWPTKRAWVAYAYETLIPLGYDVSSGYTLVRRSSQAKFIYRDELWHGADLIGTGVASFGHLQGVHVQNVDQWDVYLQRLDEGQWPLNRAFRMDAEDALIREMILQLKTGSLDLDYFQQKYQTAVADRFREAWSHLEAERCLERAPDRYRLTREGLMQVDRLLPRFFAEKYQTTRYT